MRSLSGRTPRRLGEARLKPTAERQAQSHTTGRSWRHQREWDWSLQKRMPWRYHARKRPNGWLSPSQAGRRGSRPRRLTVDSLNEVRVDGVRHGPESRLTRMSETGLLTMAFACHPPVTILQARSRKRSGHSVAARSPVVMRRTHRLVQEASGARPLMTLPLFGRIWLKVMLQRAIWRST